ncbi:hypothetical protein D3C73_1336540 [compost metagenome]
MSQSLQCFVRHHQGFRHLLLDDRLLTHVVSEDLDVPFRFFNVFIYELQSSSFLILKAFSKACDESDVPAVRFRVSGIDIGVARVTIGEDVALVHREDAADNRHCK